MTVFLKPDVVQGVVAKSDGVDAISWVVVLDKIVFEAGTVDMTKNLGKVNYTASHIHHFTFDIAVLDVQHWKSIGQLTKVRNGIMASINDPK